MKISRFAQLGAVAAIAALALAGCASNETPSDTPSATSDAPKLTGTLNGSGATSQQVAIQSWTQLVQTANPDVTINYDPQGSGTGRESFQSGAVQFAGSDRAFKTDEIAAGGFGACADGSDLVEIPAYISPIAIVFNVDGVDELNLDPATLAGIFAGTITNWNDPAIAATNDGVDLPDLAISPVHRSDKSGTTGNFTDYLSATGGSAWSYGSVEEWPIQGGEAAQGTSGVVNAIKAGSGTIGYADSSQAGDLSSVNVQVGDEWVGHSAEGAAITADASPIEDGRAATDLAIKIDRTTTEAGAYPVILISYLIGCAEYEDADTAALVQGFFNTAISAEGQDAAATNAGSAPISDALREKAQAAVDAIK
ncbi:phosphate ABC transporter substrate-binding protein PstS [Microbacterium sp. NPDC058389]|uniref:phosphate ABC transporter substrate-binding protein PstS n=1 Tax=Microbacterium sp. NPDC058389 TaxID=3346475 RepID=UPI0036690BC8